MPSLTVVMPCYNEASRGKGETSFASRLDMIYHQLYAIEYKLIMVDDGSRDDSVEQFQSFVEDYGLEATWVCLRQAQNNGKGSAVLRGILAADTDFVLVMDADLSVAPYRVVQLIHGAREGQCYIATRYAIGAHIVNPRPPIRKFISFCCITMVNMLFGLGVSDSQCGFKLLPTKYCHEMTDFVKDSWLYDVEILYNLKAQGVVINEFSVRWENMERESTINALHSIIPSVKALFMLFSKKSRIRFRHRRK